MRKPDLAPLAALLADPANSERTPEQLASLLWGELAGALTQCLNPAPPTLREGLAFSVPWSPNALHVSYMRRDVTWITWAGSRYGFLVRDLDPSADLWQYITSSRATKGGPAPNPVVQTGDRLRLRSRWSRVFVVRATTETSALLEGPRGRFQAEPCDVLRDYFHPRGTR